MFVGTSKQLSRSALKSLTKGKASAGRKATSPSTGAQWVRADSVRANRLSKDLSPTGYSFSRCAYAGCMPMLDRPCSACFPAHSAVVWAPSVTECSENSALERELQGDLQESNDMLNE